MPPPESRYALTAMIALLLLELQQLVQLKQPLLKVTALSFCFLTVGVNLSIRSLVAVKNLPVLTNQQTTGQYVTDHTTGFNKDKIEPYYNGYWQRYKYARQLANPPTVQ